MRLRQIKEFLHAVTDPDAKGSAGTKGQQGLNDLKAFIAGIIPGI